MDIEVPKIKCICQNPTSEISLTNLAKCQKCALHSHKLVTF